MKRDQHLHQWTQEQETLEFIKFPVAQTVKNLPARQETRVRSPGWETPLEKGMATHSRILAWRIPWTEELGGLQSMGSQESDTAYLLRLIFKEQI